MNVAILGCNGMGRLHARMAINAGFKVTVCGDKNLKIAQDVAAEHGATATDDCMAVVNDPNIDIIAIATPTPFHHGYLLAAAQAGKHIFCEKPLCRTIADCKEAIAAAKKGKVKLFVAHVVRFFPEFEAMRAQVLAGKTGKVGFVKMYRGGIFPAGADGWFRNYEQSGGVAFDSMIHDLDWLRYMFGDVERIFCQVIQKTEPDFIDYAQATIRMKNGVIAKVIGTWANPSGFRVEVEVCGEKGMVHFNSDEAPIAAAKRVTENTNGPKMIVPTSPIPISPYQLEWEDFAGWLNGTSTPRVTPEDGLEAVRMAAAALQSAQTGKPVKL